LTPDRLLHVIDWGGCIGHPFGTGPYLAVPSDLAVAKLNLLAKRRNLTVEAWFTTHAPSGSALKLPEPEWEFRHRWVPTAFFPGGRVSAPIPLFPNGKPDVFLSSYAEPSLLVAWMLARLTGVKSAFYQMATSAAWVRRTRIREAVKRRVIPSADGILVPGPDAARYVSEYGAAPNRIHYVRYGFAVKTWDNDHRLAQAERLSLRLELGLVGTTFVNVGRLWWGKGLVYLIEAFAAVEARHRGKVSLLLVGSGPEEYRLRQQAHYLGCNRVTFHAHIRDVARLAAMYTAADVFVFPSLGDPYGLVLDEAMACHLPIIASAAVAEVHSRVLDGVNGFIIPGGDSQALSDRMERFVADPQLAIQMGERSRQLIAQNTLELWAEDFELAIGRIALAVKRGR
jgi:glycosyltransferase involved in cell wall biosynthesis